MQGFSPEDELFAASLARSLAMACYSKELEQRRFGVGTIGYRLEVGGDGSVVRTRMTAPASPAIDQCIEDAARNVVFPPPARAPGSVSIHMGYRIAAAEPEPPAKPTPNAGESSGDKGFQVLGLTLSGHQHQELMGPRGFEDLSPRNFGNALLITVELEPPARELPDAVLELSVITGGSVIHEQKLPLRSFHMVDQRPASIPLLYYPNHLLCEPATFVAIVKGGGATSRSEQDVDFNCGD